MELILVEIEETEQDGMWYTFQYYPNSNTFIRTWMSLEILEADDDSLIVATIESTEKMFLEYYFEGE